MNFIKILIFFILHIIRKMKRLTKPLKFFENLRRIKNKIVFLNAEQEEN